MRMVRVLFVCYGNICRSPLAEFVFKHMVDEAGLSDRIDTASCATSGEHIGDPVDRRSAEVLSRHGISCAGKTARRLNRDDFSNYDYIIGMDRDNLRRIREMSPEGTGCVTGMLLDYTPNGGEVADPWYTGDFDKAYRDVQRGCTGLLDAIRRKNGWL